MPDMLEVAVEEAMDIVMDMLPVDVAVAIDIDVVISLMSILAGENKKTWRCPYPLSCDAESKIYCNKPGLGNTPLICTKQIKEIATREREPSHGLSISRRKPPPCEKGSDNQADSTLEYAGLFPQPHIQQPNLPVHNIACSY